MKQFSNITNNEKKVKILPLNKNQILEKIIDDNINIKINNEELSSKNLTIDGKSELLEKINILIEQEEQFTILETINTIKYNYNHYLNQNVLNDTINKLNETWVEMITIPSPIFIFSNEDFEINSDDSIKLYGINYIPSVYSDYLKIDEAVKYFKNNGKVEIRYSNYQWEITFEGNYSEYGTKISSNDEKYKLFINENIEFIKSFIEATNNLIGDCNVKIINKL